MKKILAVPGLTVLFFMLMACPNLSGPIGDVISIAAIPGVPAPVYGETPVTSITETDQYTGTVSWSPAVNDTFAAETVYTATITLTAKNGYTFTEVTPDFFTVAGATSVANSADSGVVTAVFPETGTDPSEIISIAAIPGVTAPACGETPVTTITETDQYTGTVSWDGGWAWASTFGGNKVYTATITLTAKSGYTLTGVAADFFTVAGATTVTNSADSGTVTATFPATTTVSVGEFRLGGKVAYILQSGDACYVAGEQRGLIISTQQVTAITWAKSAYQTTSVPGGTTNGVCAGFTNTTNIIAQNGAGETYAAGVARACSDGGFSDWYLPSADELWKIAENKGDLNISNVKYWSSSENGADGAIAYSFYDPIAPQFYDKSQYEDSAHQSLGVRAVRNF